MEYMTDFILVIRVYSAPYGIPSRWRSAGTTKLGLLIDLDSHKPVTVETTYVSVVVLCAARTIPQDDDGCRLFCPAAGLRSTALSP